MALKAGRVGVSKDQVDEFGNIIGSTPENVYTKTQCDNKFETKTHASNTYQQKTLEVPLELLGGSQLTVESSLHAIEDTFGDLQFRDNDGTPQVKTPNGDWTNFNSGGGGTLGFNIPDAKKVTTGIQVPSNVNMVDACYCVEDNVLYVDMHLSMYATTGMATIVLTDALPTGVNLRHTTGILCTDISVLGIESVNVTQDNRNIKVNIGNNHWANEVVHVFGTAQLVAS